jgi:hypothetical protein
MVKLWEHNRKEINKSRPKFPKSMKDNELDSFIAYRNRQLKYFLPYTKLNTMTEEEKEKFFRKLHTGRKLDRSNLHVKKGTVHLDRWTEKFPKGRLSDMKGKIRPEVRKMLQVKPTHTGKLVGKSPFPYNSPKAKIGNVDKRFYEFFKTHHKTHGKLYDPRYHDRINVPGVFETQWRDVQECVNPSKSKVTYEEMYEAINERFNNLELPSLDEVTVKDITTVETNPKAQCGILSGKIYGRNHAIGDRYMKRVAKSLFIASGDRTCYDTTCWTLGGRARRQKLHKDGPLRGRIIMMPEGPNKIMGLSYASKIYDGLGRINYGNFKNECQIGRNDFHGNYYKYDEYFNSLGVNTFECDISKHDAGAAEKQMVVAFGLIRACFPPSDKTDRRFIYLMSGTIFKNLLLPGRLIYRLSKSIPSGSPFTSILTTLVNWLNWSVLITNNVERKYTTKIRLNLFGDDTIANIPDDAPKELHDEYWWKDKFEDLTGYKLDPCVMRTFHARDWFNKPSFLKSMPNYGLPARLTRDTLLSSSMTRNRNKENIFYYSMVTGLAYAAPFNFESLEWIFEMRSWVYKSIDSFTPQVYERLNSTKLREMRDRITWRVLCTNYLMPLVPEYENVKNVDLGNKPKVMSLTTKLEMNVPDWIFESPT